MTKSINILDKNAISQLKNERFTNLLASMRDKNDTLKRLIVITNLKDEKISFFIEGLFKNGKPQFTKYTNNFDDAVQIFNDL